MLSKLFHLNPIAIRSRGFYPGFFAQNTGFSVLIICLFFGSVLVDSMASDYHFFGMQQAQASSTGPSPALSPDSSLRPLQDGYSNTKQILTADWSWQDHPMSNARRYYIKASLIANPSRNFKQLRAQDVANVLGRPTFMRYDTPATLWQYRAGACVMDIYYITRQGDDLPLAPVQYYELRQKGEKVSGKTAQPCLRTLLNMRKAGGVHMAAFHRTIGY